MSDCGGDTTMQFAVADGPVTLVISSGFATLGRFRCASEQNLVFTEFGSGDLADPIPDVFPVPLSGEALNGRSVLIAGNYRAGNPSESKAIKVTYDFLQKQRSIGKIEIAEKSSDIVNCSHLITFAKKEP